MARSHDTPSIPVEINACDWIRMGIPSWLEPLIFIAETVPVLGRPMVLVEEEALDRVTFHIHIIVAGSGEEVGGVRAPCQIVDATGVSCDVCHDHLHNWG